MHVSLSYVYWVQLTETTFPKEDFVHPLRAAFPHYRVASFCEKALLLRELPEVHTIPHVG